MKGTVDDLVGNTPIVRLKTAPDSADLYVKLESFNPGGSVKDRVAKAMVRDALAQGKIGGNTVLIEATSGNTGIGLAMICAAQRIPLTLVMPDSMSVERRMLLGAYGARLILTPGDQDMPGAISRVKELLAADSNYLHLDQFSNPANPRVHFDTTGPEVHRSLGGNIDAFVAGVGSGGTLTGAGKYLKSCAGDIKIVAVEPALSPILSGGKPGPHPIQGLGAGFIPPVLDTGIIDEVVPVAGKEAGETARELAKGQGLLVGISSGAAIWAALRVARELGPDKRVIAIAPDSGERYLSSSLFDGG